MNSDVTIHTSCGAVTTTWKSGELVRLVLETTDRPESRDVPDYAVELTNRIHGYFRGEGDRLTGILPIPEGTPFQMEAWSATTEVAYGETASYGDIAKKLGLGAGGARAVGMAMHQNPLPLIVPCHRIVSSTGELHGFAPGLAWKRALLDIEMPQFTLAL